MTTNPQTDPIRKGLLPCIPPPEWEFHTVYGARDEHSGVALFPGDTGPVVVRRRVTYGDWEPVRPDRWADEPESAAPAAGRVVSAAPTQTDLVELAAAAIWARYADAEPSRTGLVMANPHAVAAAVLAVLPPPADRAAVLREAADAVAELIADGEHDPDCLVAELRRLAAEAQQQEPDEHHTVDGTRYLCHADDHYCPQAEAQQQPDTETPSALMRAHVALAEQAGRDQATLARVRRLYESGPLGTCCAHLVGAALNAPAAPAEQPAAADNGEEGGAERPEKT